MPTTINPDHSRLARAPELIAADVDGEMVMMSVERGEYYGLNEVGARIWSLLASPKTLTELQQCLCAEYAVSPEQCRHELQPFIDELLARGILCRQL